MYGLKMLCKGRFVIVFLDGGGVFYSLSVKMDGSMW